MYASRHNPHARPSGLSTSATDQIRHESFRRPKVEATNSPDTKRGQAPLGNVLLRNTCNKHINPEGPSVEP